MYKDYVMKQMNLQYFHEHKESQGSFALQKFLV